MSNDHRARYKNSGLDAKELRRRREEDSVQLRKQKRDDVLSKRRTLYPPGTINDSLDDDIHLVTNETSYTINNGQSDNSELDQQQQFILTKEMIDGLMQNENLDILIDNAKKVRKILSKEPQPPFDDVIKEGLVPRFIELLDKFDNYTLQFEVAWILTNVCSGTTEQTRTVVDHGGIPKMVNMLYSPDIKVCEQAVWALGNIVGDCAEFRDLAIAHNFVPALLASIKPDNPIAFLRNQTWVLVNLCRNKDPPVDVEVTKQLIPALHYLLMTTDLCVLIDTTWAISYITDLGQEYSQLIIDSGSVEQIILSLSHKELKIQTAAIRALGAIVSGPEKQTQYVIDAGALPHINRILIENRDRIVKEALWFLSNITAGPKEQVQAVIDNNIIPSVIYYLDNGDFHQQKEAAWTIYNMCLSGTSEQLQALIDGSAIRPLCNLLDIKDINVVRNLLESLSCILEMCHVNNPEILELIEECGGLDKIENLQHNESPEIYDYASSIIEKYFSEE